MLLVEILQTSVPPAGEVPPTNKTGVFVSCELPTPKGVSSSLLLEIVAFLHAAESINKKVPTNLVIFSFIDNFVSKMILYTILL